MKTQSTGSLIGINRFTATKAFVALCCLLGSAAASADPLVLTVTAVAPDGVTSPAPEAYRWTVEEDRTKLSVPGQPATTANYSFSFHTSYMPVVAAGRVGTNPTGLLADPDVARLYAQQMPQICAVGTSTPTCLDPSKRYYVSVAAQGFQMGGAPIVFSNGGTKASAEVFLNQYPVPTSQVSVFAFNDNSPINGAPDLPREQGLEGFIVQIMEAGGTYGQSGGAVTQDGFGNPLGTTYNQDGSVKVRGTGIVKTGRDGTAVIKNLFPAKYTVFMSPPVGSDWHQTSTIEGTKGSDAWVKNNEPSFFQEFGPPGHHVFMGFTRSGNLLVQDTRDGNNNPPCAIGVAGCEYGLPTSGANSITGRIVNTHNSRTPNYNFELGAPVPECWVGLNQTGGGTSALFAQACKKDSTFAIPNVPAGTYELVVWDEPLDMIIGTQTVTVHSGTNSLGDVPVFSWFGRFQGRVFQDIDGTGLPFFAESYSKPYIAVDPVTGIETEQQKNYQAGDLKPAFGSGIAANIRFRDGSIYQSASTKADGTYSFNEVFPFFNWMAAEIDYARFKATGATIVVDHGGVVDPAANAAKLWKAEKGNFGSSDPAFAYDPWIRLNPQLQGNCSASDVAANKDANGKIIDPTACFKEGDKYFRTEQGTTLVEGMQLFLGQTNHIEWGKQPYAGQLNGAKNENGGISGMVQYAITRAEDDPRYAAAENWEPGVPRVQVDMFLDCDGDGKIDAPKNDGTAQCAEGGLSGANAHIALLPDVDNYPFCWRDPGSCDSPGKGPEDFVRSGDGTVFSFGDAFRWGTPDGTPAEQLHVALGATDSWDDSIPEGCVKADAGPVGNGGIPFAADLECFDGLYNFNQVRPALFDGGYAFGRVAGQAELPVFVGAEGKGTYIVEAVAPPGYLHVGSGDQNVAFGDELKASTAALPAECVGMELPIPEKLTLFPDEDNPAYVAGGTWRKCDMKSILLAPGTNPAANFFLYTEAPVSAHGVGFILDDTAAEFNRFSPSFGEKYAPPHLPVSVQDWSGREISRVYSDQFGSYNFLTPSTFTVNPPYPSGVMPNMMVACMNHPGPIADPGGAINADGSPKMVIDPYFNRKYTQFCYTLQYLTGKTTYLDTPVLPIAAFATVEKNPLDCECQDGTPGIYSVNNTDGQNRGPWVPSLGGDLTIVSAGQLEVPNPSYDPNVVGSPKHIVRDYGFGASGKVMLGSTELAVIGGWDQDLLTVHVPANASSDQLTIVRGDNGKASVVGLTVHVGGAAPIAVQPGASIQAVIDDVNTTNGSLITIPPGTYNEYLILDKRVRLQGWGANSVGINASKASAGGLAAWRELLAKKIDARCADNNGNPIAGSDPADCQAETPVDTDTGRPTLVPGAARTFDPLPGQTLGINPANNEPLLFGTEEGPGILAVGKSAGGGCSLGGVPYRIDGVTVTGSDSGGGILASGYNCNLVITNNRVVGNYGTYGGGIRVGHTALVNDGVFTPGVNHRVVIDHNWVSQNGASEIATGDGGGGGITMGTGSTEYNVTNNYVCGNFSMSDGGGISHVGRSLGQNLIMNNQILLNQNFNQAADPTGGGVFIGGAVPVGGGDPDGAGDVYVRNNQIQYNQAGAGAGGGVSIARTLQRDNVELVNNMIVNNATAYAGGGVALADVTNNVRIVNNTIADNVSTATNRQSFPAGAKVKSDPQVAGIARVSGNGNASLLNNIVFNNRSYIWEITPTDPNLPQTTALTDMGVWDMGRVGSLVRNNVPSTRSLFTAGVGNASNNGSISTSDASFVKPTSFMVLTDPDTPVLLPETTILQTALTADEGGNFINVNLSPLTPWDLADPSQLRADYHIKADSPAVDAGVNPNGGGNRVPTVDIDFDGRTAPTDIGADEIGEGSGTAELAFTSEDGPGNLIGSLAFNFGNVGNNAVNTLTLTASGTAASEIGAVTITGINLSIVGGTCAGQTVAVGSTCTIQMQFNGGGGFFGINPTVGLLTVNYNGTPVELFLLVTGS